MKESKFENIGIRKSEFVTKTQFLYRVGQKILILKYFLVNLNLKDSTIKNTNLRLIFRS